MSKLSRHQYYDPVRLIGKIVNFSAFGLLVIFSMWVADDVYEAYTESNRYQSLLAESAVQQDLLDDYRRVANEISKPIEDFQKRTITKDKLSQVQDRLVLLAKQSNCNLKKSAPKGHYARPLGEDGLNEDTSVRTTTSIEEAPFVLHQESLLVSIEGSLENLLGFMEKVDREDWLCSINEGSLFRRAGEANRLTMEFEVQFHEVVTGKPEEQIEI